MGLCVILRISGWKKLNKDKFIVLSSFILYLFLQNSTRVFPENVKNCQSYFVYWPRSQREHILKMLQTFIGEKLKTENLIINITAGHFVFREKKYAEITVNFNSSGEAVQIQR